MQDPHSSEEAEALVEISVAALAANRPASDSVRSIDPVLAIRAAWQSSLELPRRSVIERANSALLKGRLRTVLAATAACDSPESTLLKSRAARLLHGEAVGLRLATDAVVRSRRLLDSSRAERVAIAGLSVGLEASLHHAPRRIWVPTDATTPAHLFAAMLAALRAHDWSAVEAQAEHPEVAAHPFASIFVAVARSRQGRSAREPMAQAQDAALDSTAFIAARAFSILSVFWWHEGWSRLARACRDEVHRRVPKYCALAVLSAAERVAERVASAGTLAL